MPRRLCPGWLAICLVLIGGTAVVAVHRAWLRPPTQQLPMSAFHNFVRAQVQHSGNGYLAIIGDSITASSPEQRVCGRSVLRLAFGGAKVEGALQDIMPPLQNSRPAALVVAIGVNDAQRRITKPRAQLLADFAADYRTLLQQAKALTSKVAVVLSPPVGKDRPMGDAFLDPDLIITLNDLIRTAAVDADVPVLALSEMARSDGFAREDVQLDGVHLSPAGYNIWGRVVDRAWQTIGACDK
jgi:GDSL-like Lipase/Acylhydrolase family